MKTNFAALMDNQLRVWSRRLWAEARNKTLIMPWTGSDPNSMIQRVTELTETNNGNRATITLVLDAQGDGVVGDNQMKGNEEALGLDEFEIKFDQLRFAHATTGKMADLKTIVKFRNTARDQIGNRFAQAMDELAFLTLSGVAYTQKPDGTTRVGSQWPILEYAADVTAPTANRYRRWDATSGLVAGDTTQVDPADTPSWKMLVDAKAYAVDTFLKPMRSVDGVEVYNVFMTPKGIARLKKDSDFLEAWKHAQTRGDTNPLFKGTPHGGKRGIYIDGLNILEYRNVYHPSTWGGGAVAGQRVLLCGAQALAFADPMGAIGAPEWHEDGDDYDNRYGIAGAKRFGFRKPVFFNSHTGTVEDFGVLAIDTAI
jgi:N4-gp56 family major capsid protein